MRIERQKYHHVLVITFMLCVFLFFVTITSQAANKCTQDCSHMLTLSWCVCHFTVMHCLFNSKCKSLHLNLSSLFHSHRPCHTFSLTICSSGPFVLLSHRFYLCVYYLDSSVHPYIPFIPMVVVFVFVPSSELHPSIWAPCSLHPLHRNDCNSGCGLVLVVGAGVPEGKVWEELISIWYNIRFLYTD